MTEDLPVVFDTGPLRHFAEQGWLQILAFLFAGREVLIPESVERELRDQAHTYPYMVQVLDADWIRVHRSDDLGVVISVSRYEERLVEGKKNHGECGVLGLCEVRGYEAVIDDRVARNLGEQNGIKVTSTLNILVAAIREGQLTLPLVERIADDLLAGEYRLPFGPGGFRRWAAENGLIDPYT